MLERFRLDGIHSLMDLRQNVAGEGDGGNGNEDDDASEEDSYEPHGRGSDGGAGVEDTSNTDGVQEEEVLTSPDAPVTR